MFEDTIVIFLDIEGVLIRSGPSTIFEEECLCNLAEIIFMTKCKIIISSSYRLSEISMKKIWSNLKSVGINKEYVTIPNYLVTPDLMDLGKTKTDEIIHIVNELNLKNWIAIDDADLTILSINHENNNIISKHFVKTDPKKGLDKENVYNVIELLKI
jgi:hypothetical protein